MNKRIIKFRALVRFAQYDTYHWIYYTPKTRHSEFHVVTGSKVEDSQFTGLFDKNGVEIYEWDIVKGFSPLGKKYLGKVIYLDDTASFGFLTIPNAKENGSGRGMHELLNMEIIGNIYSNPDLLKENNDH